ncbi:signal peptidase II [bacterium]|nr:signal peptidase II [bacterium]MBU1613826.1 signal peptidase II [bacterium]
MKRRYLRLLGLALIVLLADQVTKRLALSLSDSPFEVMGEFFRLSLVMNRGGIFGLFQSFGPFLLFGSLTAILLILFLFRKIGEEEGLAAFAFGLILGGAAGNIVDRLFYGAVVDFLDLGIGALRWPTFNLADASITIGVGLLLFFNFSSHYSLKDNPGSHHKP